MVYLGPMSIAVVGAGINGLVAAARLTRAGHRVDVFEAGDRIGGAGARIHPFGPDLDVDFGATVLPLAAASPALAALGIRPDWRHPDVPLGHVGAHGSAFLHRDLDATIAGLGTDGPLWDALFRPLVDDFDAIARAILGPLSKAPAALVAQGLGAARLASCLSLVAGGAPAKAIPFRTPAARDLFAGLAAHSGLPPYAPGSAAFALFLGAAAHAVGWPMAPRGSASIAEALRDLIVAGGGTITMNARIDRLSQLGEREGVMLDLSPAAIAALPGVELPARLRRRFLRHRPGPAASRADFRLSAPVPWSDARLHGAGTVHLGGSAASVDRAMGRVSRGGFSPRPFVLLTQPGRVDPTRVRDGSSLVWAYAHVPWGTPRSATSAIEREIERAAPGFQDLIAERHAAGPAGLETDNANLRGGDIAGGAMTIAGLLARPTLRDPYRLPRGLYLASASASPGGGFHGMAGWHAAGAALADLGGP